MWIITLKRASFAIYTVYSEMGDISLLFMRFQKNTVFLMFQKTICNKCNKRLIATKVAIFLNIILILHSFID